MDYIVVSRKRSTAIIVKFFETYCKDEIELRTSKDNENENSEARDNITYNEIRLFCRLRKLQKPISFFQKLILLE
ncbi:unnamed protein product [Rhizophagus irregularis]|nr:unnamed protein product [Rhizophagus irregularis]